MCPRLRGKGGGASHQRGKRRALSGADFKKAGPPPPVISTEAKRSGEISPSDGTSGITVGDLSTQSIIKAFSICPIPTRSSARDDESAVSPYRHVYKKGAQLRCGLCRRVVHRFAQGATAALPPRVVVAPSRAQSLYMAPKAPNLASSQRTANSG